MRFQVVRKSQCFSDKSPCLGGVPQGSKLGPLLFILCTRYLPMQVSLSKIHLYADDTCLFNSGVLSQDVTNRLQFDLQKLKSWFDVNFLKLNGNKSEFILFKPSRVSHCDSSLYHLFVDGSELYLLKSVQYLGLVFDEDLSWKVHFNVVVKKCSQKIGALHRYSRCLTIEAKQSFWTAVI